MRESQSGLIRAALAVALTTAGWSSARPQIVINEVLYDPPGPDEGREFVELANAGPYAAVLQGLELHAGNGARPNDWKPVWRGSAGTAIPPGSVYRIGVAGPGLGEPADLRLQNGPDGVRLVKHGFELDRVGWGDHTHPEYHEGRPARLVRVGMSLARSADGVDTDDNAADFEEAIPSPGRPNRPMTDWAIRFGPIAPERPRPGETVLARVDWIHRGRISGVPPPVGIDDGVWPVLVASAAQVEVGGSASQRILLSAPARADRIVWRLRSLETDEVPENDRDSLHLRVGPGPIRITEVLASPATGGCEWIELRIDAAAGETLAGYEIAVRGRAIALASRSVAEETRYGVVAQDSILLFSRYSDLPGAALWRHAGSWPRLRDGDRRSGVSDTIRVLAPDRCVEDVAIPGPVPAPGVSLVRLDLDLPEGPAAWVPSIAAGGSSPGGPDRGEGVGTAERLSASPRTVRPPAEPCTLLGSVGTAPGRVRLDIVDLLGETKRTLLRDLWVAGPLVATWDGTDASGVPARPGVYVAVLEIVRPGAPVEHQRVALGVAPAGDP